MYTHVLEIYTHFQVKSDTHSQKTINGKQNDSYKTKHMQNVHRASIIKYSPRVVKPSFLCYYNQYKLLTKTK